MYKQRKRSKIWEFSIEELQEIVYHHNTLSDILREINVPHLGSGHKILKKRIERDGIDIKHIPLGPNSNKGRKRKIRKYPRSDKEIFCENSEVDGSTLKRRIFRRKIIKYICNICGNKGIWRNKQLSLPLNHKNGIKNDNRPENLEFLCPNCHSQTSTFAGRNKGKR